MSNWMTRLLGGAKITPAVTMPGVGAPLTPFQSHELSRLVYTDIYGPSAGLVDRAAAMRCAPVNRGRSLIVANLAGLPFEQGSYDAAGEFVPDEKQPEWLTTTGPNNNQTPWLRMAWSLDDLLFYGWCLWAVERDDAGNIIDAVRVDPNRWNWSDSGIGVAIDGQTVTDRASVLLFAGPHEGLLHVAAETIRGWGHMERAWVGRVRNPIPLIVLHEKQENGVPQSVAQQYVDAWSQARTSDNGAVGWLPATIDLEVHGQVEADLFDKGRNAARLDFANHMNLPASALDGSAATASLTYVTKEGDRNQLIDDLEFWIDPFDARLSQSDVADAGKVIRLRRATMTATPNDPYGSDRGSSEPPATEQNAHAGGGSD